MRRVGKRFFILSAALVLASCRRPQPEDQRGGADIAVLDGAFVFPESNDPFPPSSNAHRLTWEKNSAGHGMDAGSTGIRENRKPQTAVFDNPTHLGDQNSNAGARLMINSPDPIVFEITGPPRRRYSPSAAVRGLGRQALFHPIRSAGVKYPGKAGGLFLRINRGRYRPISKEALPFMLLFAIIFMALAVTVIAAVVYSWFALRSRRALKDLDKTEEIFLCSLNEEEHAACRTVYFSEALGLEEEILLRSLNEEERAACRTVYFSEALCLEQEFGYAVFHIQGSYSWRRMYRSDIKDHYIGAHSVLWHPAMDACVETDNTAEIVLLSDGRGIIISLNNRFFLTEEAKLRAFMENMEAVKAAAAPPAAPVSPDAGLPSDTLVLQDAALQKLPEKFKPELGKYLGEDLRVPALLLACTAGLTPFFINPPAALPAAAVLAASAVLLLFWKKYPYKPLNQRIYLLTGTILKVITRKGGAIAVSQMVYRIGRFQLNIPRRWLPGLLTGTPVTLRGFPEETDAVEFRVLSAQGGLSLETMYERKDPRRLVRGMLCCAVFAVMAAALFFTPKHPVKAAARIAAYTEVKELPKDFSGFEAVLAAGNLRAGQEIQVALIPVIAVQDYGAEPPASYRTGGYYMVSEGTSFDFTGLRKRMDALAELQKTGLALLLYIRPMDALTQMRALDALRAHLSAKTAADFAGSFPGNAAFPELAAAEKEFRALDLENGIPLEDEIASIAFKIFFPGLMAATTASC